MAYVWDIAVILILAICVFLGHKRGFARSAVWMAGCVAAILIAGLLGSTIANGVYDATVGKSLDEATASLSTTSSVTLEEQADKLISSVPKWTRTILQKFGMTSGKTIVQKWQPDAEKTLENLADSVVKPPIMLVLRLLFFVILALALLIAAWFLSRFVQKVCKLPILRQFDEAYGSIIGLAQGVLWVIVLTAALQLVAGISESNRLLSAEVLEKTHIVKWVLEWNPLTASSAELANWMKVRS